MKTNVKSAVFGFEGNDQIYVGYDSGPIVNEHDNRIYAGAGNDDVWIAETATGNNTVFGWTGDDTISVSGPGDNLIYGNCDNDQITLHETAIGNNTIYGGYGDDTVYAYAGRANDAVIDGEAGENDLVFLSGSHEDNVLSNDANLQNIQNVGLENDATGVNLTGQTEAFRIYSNPDPAKDSHIIGGGGNDTIFGNVGIDIIDGGDGTNTLNYLNLYYYNPSASVDVDLAAGAATVYGSSYEQTFFNIQNVIGSPGNDSIVGSTSSNRIQGHSGEDTIEGIEGNNVLIGGTGFYDEFEGGYGWGHGGNSDANSIVGGPGNDTIISGAGNDTIDGSGGENLILAKSGDNLIHGGSSHDKIWSRGGNNTIDGGDGNDTIKAFNSSSHSIMGDHGSYVISIDDPVYDDGVNEVSGGAGHDLIITGLGNDTVYGDEGNDYIFVLGGNNSIDGGPGNDTIISGTGDDDIIGGDGDDVFHITGGVDGIADLGNGNDVLKVYAAATVVAELHDPAESPPSWIATADSENNGTATIHGVSDKPNTIDVSAAGGENGWEIFGGSDNDTLIGGPGSDTLTGGAGDDQFHFGDVIHDNNNVITDFGNGANMIHGLYVNNSGVLNNAFVEHGIASSSPGFLEADSGFIVVFDASGNNNTAASLAPIDVAAFLSNINGDGFALRGTGTPGDNFFVAVSDNEENTGIFHVNESGDPEISAEELTLVVTLEDFLMLDYSHIPDLDAYMLDDFNGANGVGGPS